MHVVRYDISDWTMVVTMQFGLGQPDFTVTYEMNKDEIITRSNLNPAECRDGYILSFLMDQLLQAKY